MQEDDRSYMGVRRRRHGGANETWAQVIEATIGVVREGVRFGFAGRSAGGRRRRPEACGQLHRRRAGVAPESTVRQSGRDGDRLRGLPSTTMYAVAPGVVKDKCGRWLPMVPDGASATSTWRLPQEEQECGDATSDGD